MQEHDTDLLEILNTYMDLAEKQEEVIPADTDCEEAGERTQSY